MSNSLPTSSASARRQSSVRAGRKSYAVPADTIDLLAIANGYEDYESFVGGLQFWGYALISGSADGGVRMWDSTLFEASIDPAPDIESCSEDRTGSSDSRRTHSAYNVSPIRRDARSNW